MIKLNLWKDKKNIIYFVLIKKAIIYQKFDSRTEIYLVYIYRLLEIPNSSIIIIELKENNILLFDVYSWIVIII